MCKILDPNLFKRRVRDSNYYYSQSLLSALISGLTLNRCYITILYGMCFSRLNDGAKVQQKNYIRKIFRTFLPLLRHCNGIRMPLQCVCACAYVHVPYYFNNNIIITKISTSFYGGARERIAKR